MKIVVCVKQTPDSAASLTVAGGKVSWGDAPLIINPWDEYAVEAALQQKEVHGGTVTAISVGSEEAGIALKHALAMGADDALRIPDPGPASDTGSVARLLAAAIRKLGGVDLVCFGRQAIDGDSGLVPTQVARLLGWPALTLVSSVKIEDGVINVECAFEEGRQSLRANLPAVLSLAKDFGEPRFPSFLNKRKADRAVLPLWTLEDLGVAASVPVITWGPASLAPVRESACEFLTGSPQEMAQALVEKLLAEKVL